MRKVSNVDFVYHIFRVYNRRVTVFEKKRLTLRKGTRGHCDSILSLLFKDIMNKNCFCYTMAIDYSH